jgi:AcrR family transcriptional regulator
MKYRRERKDAVEHRQLILQTAKLLFNEYGVHPVSMHQIAKTAGIGQATLYRRYAHKGQLCSDIMQDYIQQLMEAITTYLQANTSNPAEERLGGILDHWIDALEDKYELIIAMESKAVCEDDRMNFFTTPMYHFLREHISKLIVEIEKERPSTADPIIVAHAIICSLNPIGYFYMKQERGYTKEQMKTCFRQTHRCSVPTS